MSDLDDIFEGFLDFFVDGREGSKTRTWEQFQYESKQKFMEALMPKIRVCRIDKDLPELKFAKEGDIGIDLYSRVDVIIPPQTMVLVPLNVIVEYPAGYGLFVAPRSSLFKNKGLILVNSPGVIDEDYHHDGDEIKAGLFNLTHNESTIGRGERICQMILLPFDRPDIIDVENPVEGPPRGGFGSTGL